jgi:signal transduction histidine kinase
MIEEVIVDRKLMQPALRLGMDRGTEAGKEVQTGRRKETTLEIPAGRGEVEIHYTALSLQAPEKNRFKYKLDNVDQEWIDGGTRREAFYANVGPGNYRFQVMACNNDGVWSENGASLALVLLPHYWQTTWFKAASVAGLAAILAAGYHSRVSRLREIEALRIQIAADLHDDVGARLTKVAMVTELVDRGIPESDHNKSQIRNIANTTNEVIQAMDEIVWTINPSNDTVDHLANYLFQHTQEYFQNTNVRCRLDFPAKLPQMQVSTEARHNLFMAVKEALNNVLKHAQATEVRVSLAVENGKLMVSIDDNGSGFSPGAEREAGEGLRNMKQRLEQIDGKLRIDSAPGKGTRVQMEAKVG